MANNYRVILTYDISRAGSGDTVNAYVKNRMIELGYADRFENTSTGKTIYLPNTTLLHMDKTCAQAREDVKLVVKEFNDQNKTSHEAERILALEFTDKWAAIQGEAHKSESKTPKI